MRKMIMVFLLAVLSAAGCAQEKTASIMSTADRISYLSERVHRFKDEPLYQLEVESLFSYRILLNGCPIYSFFGKTPGMIRIDINPYILKSGQQSVTIELYPGYDSQGTPKQYLETGSKFSLKIEKTGWGKDGTLKEPVEIVSYSTADEQINLTELTAYKKNISFTATVPYKLEGWMNGQDLTKLDSQRLEQQLLDFYRRMIAAFEIKDYDDLNTQFLHADAEWYQSLYFPKDIVTKFQTTQGRKGKSMSTTSSDSMSKARTFYPLEDYVIRFYADGRMVRLEAKDGANKGESLLGYEDIDKHGLNRKTWIDMLFYMPKGETALQIIR